MNRLLEIYPQEVQEILAKYPPDEKRAAVMSLIYLAQRERNYLVKQDLIDIGEIAGVSSTDVAGLVGFYTLYHQEPGGKYRIQVCNDLPCALRGADEFLEKLCENLGVKLEQTTPDGLFTVEAVMCLAGCNHAPMFQVQSGEGLSYHEDQSVDSAMALIESLREKEAAQPAGEVQPELHTPVLPVAEQGVTRISRQQRIQIQEEGGQ